MLATLLDRVPAEADAVVTPAGTASGDALRADAEALGPRLAAWRGTRVALKCLAVPQTFAALVALERAGAQVVLADDAVLDDETAMRDLGIAGILVPTSQGPATVVDTGIECAPVAAPGPLVLLTSGTTGRPKPVLQSWPSLASSVREGPTERWGCGYRLRLFAACQVLAQAWASGGCLAVSDGPADGTAGFWAAAAVTAASATPSFWRRLLLSGDPALLAGLPLRQITMGGEPADQPLLDRLRAVFPEARVTHIYATTELGRCFAVSDGRAGFPAAWLAGGPPGGAALRVEGGELVVGSPAGFHRTGDMVTIEGDRVQFSGRRDDLLNVGGEKVAPLAIETRLRALPEIGDVRVFGRRSSIVGQLIACEVVPAHGVAADLARAAVDAYAQGHLAPAARPRIIEIVDRITLSAADKAARTTGEN